MTDIFNTAFTKKLLAEISEKWDDDIIPQLKNYIRIPNKSPMFDHQWEEHGYMKQAFDLVIAWMQKQKIAGLTFELLQLPNRTPLLFIEIPGQIDETVLLYGHLDKQPEMYGWEKDLGPWTPVLKENKLYGRGGADDGYAIFAALTAIASLQRHQIPHARCVIIIEASEESGSVDLPAYLELLHKKIKNPNFVVCLDSGAGNYDQLWATTSLRGNCSGNLKVEVMSEGIHSGVGSGVVPNPFMILRQLLQRVEDDKTGKILMKEMFVEIPAAFQKQARQVAKILGNKFVKNYTFLPGVKCLSKNPAELILNRTWRPTLSVTGIDGLATLENASNVTIPQITVKLSFRTPPTLSTKKIQPLLKKIFLKNTPFNAKVTYTGLEGSDGWCAPHLAKWLETANDQASQQFFGKPAAYLGEGGTIPFMGMLGKQFPNTQFLITGVLGPHSNAHGPNEFLYIPFAKKLTGCVASVIAAHCRVYQK